MLQVKKTCDMALCIAAPRLSQLQNRESGLNHGQGPVYNWGNPIHSEILIQQKPLRSGISWEP